MDFYFLLAFGVLGYIMEKAKIPSSPLILAVIVGNSMEQSFRRAFVISDGSMDIFFKSPICIIFFALTVISIGYPLLKNALVKLKERS
jgi:putative tricarboxylic transport membrane protein